MTDGAHLERAADLVEQAYANTGLPVYLGGHSNGPLYALALLNSKSVEWRAKYIGEPKISKVQWQELINKTLKAQSNRWSETQVADASTRLLDFTLCRQCVDNDAF